VNSLIYAPGLAGHLQSYCRVLARALLKAGHRVAIAAPAATADWRDRWPLLRPLADEERVRAVDTRTFGAAENGNLTAEQLRRIQLECRADATLFVHADSFADQFRRIAAGAAPRLRGRVCAIFARTSEWCPGEDAYTGTREPWIGPTLRRTVGRWKRALLARTSTSSSRRFFEGIVLRRRLVDALIVKDERIPQRFGPPVYWMPEIYRVFDVREDERRGPDWERFAEPMQRYMDRAGARNLLLFFGTGAWYKGYDLFLQLAHSSPDTFALHAGAPDAREPGKPYACDVEALRAELLREGRLFETRAFVESDDLIRLAFNGIERFVSTHRLTLTSGTVLQALAFDKPVLTPDTGLIGWRTRTAGLGSVYRYQDIADLTERWNAARRSAAPPPVAAIRRFMLSFSQTAVERFFTSVMVGHPPPSASAASGGQANGDA